VLVAIERELSEWAHVQSKEAASLMQTLDPYFAD
jgi:hypothetical protein